MNQGQYDERGFPFFVHLSTKVGPGTPSLLHRAAQARGLPSASAYLREVLAEAFSRDLGLDLEEVRPKVALGTRRTSPGAAKPYTTYDEVR